MSTATPKSATRAALAKIANRTFAGSRADQFFYDRLIADCTEIAQPLMARGFLLGGKGILRIFESAPVHEKWFSWFQYFILCYLTEDVPQLDRNYLNKIYDSGNFPLPELQFYAKPPNLAYERARIVHALSAHYPRSSPYFFLANGLTALAARPGFYAPAFAPIYLHYLNDQNYDMVLSAAYMFFRECDQKNLYARMDSDYLGEILDVFEWVVARPEPRLAPTTGMNPPVAPPANRITAKTPAKTPAKTTPKRSRPPGKKAGKAKKKTAKKAAVKSKKKSARKVKKAAGKKAVRKKSK